MALWPALLLYNFLAITTAVHKWQLYMDVWYETWRMRSDSDLAHIYFLYNTKGITLGLTSRWKLKFALQEDFQERLVFFVPNLLNFRVAWSAKAPHFEIISWIHGLIWVPKHRRTSNHWWFLWNYSSHV